MAVETETQQRPRVLRGPWSRWWPEALVLVVAVTAAALTWRSGSARFQLGAGAVVAGCAALCGWARQWRSLGRVDPMGPSAFPLVYVGVSTLVPAWMVLVQGQALMGFHPELYGSRSAALLSLSVIGFSAGVVVSPSTREGPAHRRSLNPLTGDISAARRLHLLGRGLIVLLVVVAAFDLLHGGVQGRALAQSTYQLTDSLNAAALIAAVPAVILIMTTRESPSTWRDGLIDVALVVALIGASAASGGRTTSLEILVTVTFFLTRKRNSARRAALALGIMLLFAVSVLFYRQHQTGAQDSGIVTSVATDLSPVSYTVGIVDARVPSMLEFQHGITFGDAVVRQLPSVVTQPLLGTSTHSGSQLFRHQILHQTNQNSGYGFSLPAEGYLNFGAWGVAGVPLVVALLLSWAYARADSSSLHPLACAYVVILASLPLAYRSDSLGAIKGVLYPLIFFWLICVTWQRLRAHAVRGSVPDQAQPLSD